MQDVAVAYPLAAQALRGGQRGAVAAAQEPAAVPLAVVGEPDAGVLQQLGQQLGQRHGSGSATSTRRWGELIVTRARPGEAAGMD